jgi:PAS domain S-box-containing protein
MYFYMGKARTHAVFSLAALLAWCGCTFALDPSLDTNQYSHTAWRIRDSFIKGWVAAIAQTPDGYLWLGTEFGLLRFDGVQTVPWQPPGNVPLPSGRILSLLVSRDGTLWIGTAKGLANSKGSTVTQFPELEGEAIYALFEDREATIWVGAGGEPRSGKLCAVRGSTVDCYGGDGRLGHGVFAFYEDRNSNLWVGVEDGLWRWKPGPPKFYSLPSAPNGIHAVGEGFDGALLVGWKGGIYRFTEGKMPLPWISHQLEAKKILSDRNGGIWIATWNHGIVHFHQGRTDLFTASDGLSGDDVQNLFEDREGNIWVSTLEGLDRFRDYAVATLTSRQGLSSDLVGSILAGKDGRLWFATYGGLNRSDQVEITIPSTGSSKRDGKLNGSNPSSLFQDDQGRIWISTLRGLGYLENGRFNPIKGAPFGHVPSITQDTASNLWLVDETVGLVRMSPKGDIRQIPWGNLGHSDHGTALAADHKPGGLWIGFVMGGISYLTDGQVRASYGVADGLGKGRVSDFLFDHNGTLWISTEGGLSRLKNSRLATLSSKIGLPCDKVHWTIEDKDHSFWLYTACGLVRIARPELEAWATAVDKGQDKKPSVQVTTFDSSDGVRSLSEPGYYHPQVAKTPDGKLWFLPWDGVSVIDPHHLPFNKLPPSVHIEKITADDNAVEISNGMHLPTGVRHLDIDYTALSLVVPEKVRFRVKLEGEDKDWRELVNVRHVEYTNLPPRHYRFRVLASNNSGVWNEEGASLDFVIPPAWYQTNWFRAVCVAVFVGLIWLAYWLRVHELEEREKKFREAVESLPGLAFIARSDGYRTFLNKGWVEYTGISAEQASGSGWQAAVHPDELRRVLDKWRSATAAGEPFDYESRLRHADGNYRWFHTRVVPLRDKRGKVVKWCGLATDIEDRKRAEQLQADLAHTNRVSLLGELAASIAHEVNQPLSGIVSNAGASLRWLAGDAPNMEEAREAARRIVRDGKRAGEIIYRLRSLYKKTPPKRELIDVNEIIGEMVAMLRSEANRFAVSIRTELAADLPRITADGVQLQQVLMNLMLNGIEAMNQTGGVLTVKSQPEDGHVVISVSDTGIGLPPEKADRIFDAFYTTKPQGSGMGLAISRSIIESHHGRIWATANDGRGASFHFSLPTAVHAEEAPAAGA